MHRDRVKSADGKVVMVGCKARCTWCNKWKPLSAFGLRKLKRPKLSELDDGVEYRNQSQCSECRSTDEYKAEADALKWLGAGLLAAADGDD